MAETVGTPYGFTKTDSPKAESRKVLQATSPIVDSLVSLAWHGPATAFYILQGGANTPTSNRLDPGLWDKQYNKDRAGVWDRVDWNGF